MPLLIATTFEPETRSPSAGAKQTLVVTKVAQLVLVVVLLAMAFYYARTGIELHERGFNAGEVAFILGASLTMGTVSVLGGIAIWR
jgi:hypothetical protein